MSSTPSRPRSGGRCRTPPARGLAPLREALAAELDADDRAHASTPTPEILVTNGAMQALGVCFRSLVEPGDEVVVPAPCFFFEGPIRAAGAVPVYVPGSAADGWRWDVDALEAGDRRANASPAPLQPRQPDRATCPRREDVAAAVSAGRAARAPRRHRRGVRGVLWGDATLASAFGLGEDVVVIRSLGKSLSLPQLRIGLPGRAGGARRGVRADARVGLPAGRRRRPGGGARRARRARGTGSRRSTPALAADREVALEAVEATPGLDTVAPRAAPFLFVGSDRGDGLADRLRGSRAAGRRRRGLPGSRLRPAPLRRRRRRARRARSRRSAAWSELHAA